MAEFHDMILIDMRLHSLSFYLMGMKNDKLSFTRCHSFAVNYRKEGRSEALDIAEFSTNFKAGLALAVREAPNADEIVLIGLGRNYCLMQDDFIIEPFYLTDGRLTPSLIKEIDLQISYPLRYDFSGSEEGKAGSFYRLVAALKKGKLKEATDFLFPIEYLFFKLTGKKVHDTSLARTNGFIDIHNNRYSNALVHGAGIPMRFLPTLSESFTAVEETNDTYTELLGKKMTVRLGGSRNYTANFMIPTLDDTVFVRMGDSPCVGAQVKAPYTAFEMRLDGFRTGYAKGLPTLEKRLRVGNLINHFLNQSKLKAADLEEEVRASRYSNTVSYANGTLSKADNIKTAINDYFEANGLPKPKTNADYLRCLYLSLVEFVYSVIEEYETQLDVRWGNFCLINAESESPYLAELFSRRLGKDTVLSLASCEVKGAYVATIEEREKEKARREEEESEDY